jgi:hypothetical protein
VRPEKISSDSPRSGPLEVLVARPQGALLSALAFLGELRDVAGRGTGHAAALLHVLQVRLITEPAVDCPHRTGQEQLIQVGW